MRRVVSLIQGLNFNPACSADHELTQFPYGRCIMLRERVGVEKCSGENVLNSAHEAHCLFGRLWAKEFSRLWIKVGWASFLMLRKALISQKFDLMTREK